MDGLQAGSWIKESIEDDGPGHLVRDQIPSNFDSYVRVLHPAYDSLGQEISWAEVASQTGGVVHPQVQWDCLVASTDSPMRRWRGNSPDLGEMPYPQLDRLCRVLSRHTADASHCFFGISTTLGRLQPSENDIELLKLVDREFAVFSGPLKAAGLLGIESPAETERCYKPVTRRQSLLYLSDTGGQAPNLIWPSDATWCVASEIDFDSTLVGGSRELIDDILDCDGLEGFAIRLDDSLGAHADTRNC